MGRWGARQTVFFLLLTLATASAAQTFSECFSAQPPQQFWLSPFYPVSNPSIANLAVARFYAFQFDGSLSSLELGNASICGGDCLRASAPPDESANLGPVSKELSLAEESLSSAKENLAYAHALSARGKSAARNMLDPLAYAQMLLPAPVVPPHFLSAIGAIPDLASYLNDYESFFQQSLSSSSSAYNHLNAALAALASKSDEELSWLSKAGAGSPQYSGAAKSAYFGAHSALSSGSFCTAKKAEAIEAYFSAAPALPDFSKVSFGGYVDSAGGRRQDSSIRRLLSNYLALRNARVQMISEYEGASRSASDSIALLSVQMNSLGDEKLELIGEGSQAGGPSQSLVVGQGFSGIYGGYKEGAERLSEASAELALSRQSRSAALSDNYLSDAISHAKAADEVARQAAQSLLLVRQNAIWAVRQEKEAAQGEISLAEQKTASAVSTLSDAESLASASRSLLAARQAYDAAGTQKSLGDQFAGYSRARQFALAASSAMDSRASLPLVSEARGSVDALSLLVKNAESDGLDVSYERDRLEQMGRLISGSSSPEIARAVAAAAAQDRASLLLRLYEKYAHLEGVYADAKGMVAAIREIKPSFVSPSFDSLSVYFSGGKLDTASAAGQLSRIQAALGAISAQCESQIPEYLSYVLSRNARAYETHDPAVLGESGKYSATIVTFNPSSFRYGGPISFAAYTSLPLYSSDAVSGDPISDASYDGGKTRIVLGGIDAGQRVSVGFERADQPAQITSFNSECTGAHDSQADVSGKIEFFSSRDIPALQISIPVPAGVAEGRAEYSGKAYALSPSASGDGEKLSGAIANVKAGKNSLAFSYSAQSPFSVSQESRTYEQLSGGAKHVSYLATVSGERLDCATMLVSLAEPFAGVSSFSVQPLGSEKVLSQNSVESSGLTRLQFVASPLKKGAKAIFAVSFTLQNSSEALQAALASAELQVLRYNRTQDAAALSEARLLSSMNRTEEALSLLSKMHQEGALLAFSEQDRQAYAEKQSELQNAISAAQEAQRRLLLSNLTSHAAMLSDPIGKLQSALEAAKYSSETDGYQKALLSLRKAESDFNSAIAGLSWKAALEAASEYAKASKNVPGQPPDSLLLAQDAIAEANRLYAAGEQMQSFISSAQAQGVISSATASALEESAAAQEKAAQIRAEYALLRSDAQAGIAAFASQYSSLSGQSRKQLPFSPSDAQKRLDEADKALAASAKASLSAQDALGAANSAYQKLVSLNQSIASAMSSMQASAQTSLDVARVALSEAKAKTPDKNSPDLQQIQNEVARAEDFYSNAMYADSLMSSDRAIRAVNTLLSGASAGGIDAKTALLAAISLLFIAAAAWFFLKGGKAGKQEKKSEKKELPREG